MEESKAAAYYDELTRKGEGAARFKQGLGFGSGSGSSNDAVPIRSSALSSSSSSFLSSFVKASSPSKSSQLEKEAQLASIQNKLKKKPTEQRKEYEDSRVSERDRERRSRRRSRSRSRSRSRERDKERYSRRRDRSRSRDRERHSRRRSRSRSRYSERSRRKRSESPRREPRRNGGYGEREKALKDRIEGYDKMTPAERVKAKMKLQLVETAQKDASIGMGSGWERFEFDKDAPLDDEEIEAAEDDAAVVKHVGQSFRFTAIEERRKEQIKAAHDEAMFGASSFQPSATTDSEPEAENNKSHDIGLPTSLLSEKVLAKQQGSWRDRARKV